MEINLSRELAAIIAEQAKRRGITPESLAIEVLQQRFPLPRPELSHEEFMKRIDSIGVDCGVSPPNSAMSSDELYD
jgi:hypothetical protein